MLFHSLLIYVLSFPPFGDCEQGFIRTDLCSYDRPSQLWCEHGLRGVLPPCLCCFLLGLRRGTHVCVLSQVVLVPSSCLSHHSYQAAELHGSSHCHLEFCLIDYNLHLDTNVHFFVGEGEHLSWV